MRYVRFLCGLSLIIGCGSDNGTRDSGSGSASLGSFGDSGDGGTQSDSADGADDADGGDDGVNPNFDVGSPDGGASCGGGDGASGGTLSYIWIANSSQDTISKINTETIIEEGRYLVRPTAGGSPSRTSVNLNGNVGVANRQGGVTKVWANPADCSDTNATPGIQTSTGAADILAWGEEECVAWHLPLSCASNRPMAWTQGTWNNSTCRYDDAMLWTSCWNANPEVMLLDGETGAVAGSVVIPEITTLIYGGAVDGNGDFWGLQSGGAALIRVRQDFTYEIHPPPVQRGYGIAVDAKGRPWFCGGGGAARFDVMTQTWAELAGTGSNIGGCMTDGQGTLWHSRYNEGIIVGIDTDSVTQVVSWPIPAYVHGVSVDFNGYVWGVQFSGSDAYRVDPMTGQVDTYTGLTSAYTYSDMTGFALSSAGAPSG